MENFKRNILITGGAGFIGSHVVRLFVNKYPEYRIINLDKLTYAGNLANLKDIEDKENYVFVKADICDYEKMQEVMQQYHVDGGKPRGPLDQGSLHLRTDERDGYAEPAAGSEAVLGKPAGEVRGQAVLPHLDGRGVWCTGDDAS